MEFNINSYVSVENIFFGEKRDEVRNKLKVSYDSFFKTDESKVETDAFDELGVHVYYDNDILVEAVELFEPSNPKHGNIELLNLPYTQILRYFKNIDSGLEEFDSGFTSFKYGIGVYAPFKDEEPHLECESVIVFKEGYYS